MVNVVVFAVTAVLALAGGVGVIASRAPVHSALALLLVLMSLAVDYLLLGAQFIAVLQVIIYAGAIVVLFLFIIMLLNVRTGEGARAPRVVPPALAAVLVVAFTALLVAAVATAGGSTAPPGGDFGTVQQVGRALFNAYALPFEAASIVLVVGMIGAVALGKRPAPTGRRGADGR